MSWAYLAWQFWESLPLTEFRPFLQVHQLLSVFPQAGQGLLNLYWIAIFLTYFRTYISLKTSGTDQQFYRINFSLTINICDGNSSFSLFSPQLFSNFCLVFSPIILLKLTTSAGRKSKSSYAGFLSSWSWWSSWQWELNCTWTTLRTVLLVWQKPPFGVPI